MPIGTGNAAVVWINRGDDDWRTNSRFRRLRAPRHAAPLLPRGPARPDKARQGPPLEIRLRRSAVTTGQQGRRRGDRGLVWLALPCPPSALPMRRAVYSEARAFRVGATECGAASQLNPHNDVASDGADDGPCKPCDESKNAVSVEARAPRRAMQRPGVFMFPVRTVLTNFLKRFAKTKQKQTKRLFNKVSFNVFIFKLTKITL